MTSRDLVSQVVQMLGGDSNAANALFMRERVAHTTGAPMPQAWEAVRRMGAKDPTAIPRRTPTEAV